MIRPIKNQILIEPITGEEVSLGGIIVPDSFKARGAKAKVIAVGNGSKDRPMKIPKNVVLWHIKDAGVQVPKELTEGRELYLIDDREVLGYAVIAN